jgi:hypothetical protein
MEEDGCPSTAQMGYGVLGIDMINDQWLFPAPLSTTCSQFSAMKAG